MKKIIIGDDSFLEPIVMSTFENRYQRRLEDALDVEVTLHADPSQVIDSANQYDVVVTDLDYTGEIIQRTVFVKFATI